MNKRIAIIILVIILVGGFIYLVRRFEIIKIAPVSQQTEEVSLNKEENTPGSHATAKICAVYFTGVGCPHCSVADPKVLVDYPQDYANLIVIEYEIYQQMENAPLLEKYHSKYSSGLGVPLMIFRKDQHQAGDRPILKGAPEFMESVAGNFCPLLEEAVAFEKLNLASMPGFPKIWVKDRILISSGDKKGDSQILKELLTTKEIASVLEKLEKIEHQVVDPKPVPLSGKNVEFKKAVKIEDWTFQWNE